MRHKKAQPTYFKNLENPTSIDPILTDHPKGFLLSGVYETGLSDIHELTVLNLFSHKA